MAQGAGIGLALGARRTSRAVALVALGALLAGRASAQGVRVAGTVWDSAAARPLAGAVVQLVPAGDPTARVRSAATDSLGRFTIDSIARGRWLATFLHPRLDALNVGAPEYLLGIASTLDDLALAIPSAPRVIARHCAGLPDGTGAIVGRLRDARTGEPLAGVPVAGEWRELVVAREGTRWEPQGSAAVSAADGWVALCGLPPGGDVLVRATRDADTLVLSLGIPEGGLVARDLRLGRVVTRVAGTVRTAEGAPVAGARVGLTTGGAGAPLERVTAADSGGRWTLEGVAGGTRVLETRAIGFAPDRRVVDLVDEPPLPPQEIVLASLRSLLDTVHVRAARGSRALARFAERRRSNPTGRFMDSLEIRRVGVIRPSHLLDRMPGLTIVPTLAEDGRTLHLVRARGGFGFQDVCTPAVFVDGIRLPVDDVRAIDDLVLVEEMAAIEVYQSQGTPAEYANETGCVTVLLWTNRRRLN